MQLSDYLALFPGASREKERFMALAEALLRQAGDLMNVIASVRFSYGEIALNPFGVEDKSDSSLQDVNEGDWYYEVVRFAYENGMMQPVAEDRFGVADDTSMGELCGVYCAMLGVANSPEDSIALLAQYGVLTPDTTVDEKLTREDLIIMSYYFCALVGIEPGESTLGEYPDAAEADPQLAGILAWMLENGLMAAHDGELKLTENANRADAAQLLVTLYNILF